MKNFWGGVLEVIKAKRTQLLTTFLMANFFTSLDKTFVHSSKVHLEVFHLHTLAPDKCKTSVHVRIEICHQSSKRLGPKSRYL